MLNVAQIMRPPMTTAQRRAVAGNQEKTAAPAFILTLDTALVEQQERQVFQPYTAHGRRP